MSALTVAGGTKIEWADFTFNPWWGCERVSPGCAHCYAETLSKRRQPGVQLWGDGHGFRFFGDGHWAEPLKWARLAPAKLGRRPRVFCASMADVFEDRDELHEHRYRLFALIDSTPELDWLVLTKRPEYARTLLTDPFWWARVEGTAQRLHFERTGRDAFWLAVHGPLPNVWLGVSIENSRYTWRADVLREIPAAVRFISAEPLLGSLFAHGPESSRRAPDPPPSVIAQAGDGTEGASGGDGSTPSRPIRKPLDPTGIDWVIVGGESGPGARPFHLEHAREIIHACRGHRDAITGPAVFVKQLGAKPVEATTGLLRYRPLGLTDRKGGDPSEWPADLRIREFPRSAA